MKTKPPDGMDETFWELTLEELTALIDDAAKSRRKSLEAGYMVLTARRKIIISVRSSPR